MAHASSPSRQAGGNYSPRVGLSAPGVEPDPPPYDAGELGEDYAILAADVCIQDAADRTPQLASNEQVVLLDQLSSLEKQLVARSKDRRLDGDQLTAVARTRMELSCLKMALHAASILARPVAIDKVKARIAEMAEASNPFRDARMERTLALFGELAPAPLHAPAYDANDPDEDRAILAADVCIQGADDRSPRLASNEKATLLAQLSSLEIQLAARSKDRRLDGDQLTAIVRTGMALSCLKVALLAGSQPVAINKVKARIAEMAEASNPFRDVRMERTLALFGELAPAPAGALGWNEHREPLPPQLNALLSQQRHGSAADRPANPVPVVLDSFEIRGAARDLLVPPRADAPIPVEVGETLRPFVDKFLYKFEDERMRANTPVNNRANPINQLGLSALRLHEALHPYTFVAGETSVREFLAQCDDVIDWLGVVSRQSQEHAGRGEAFPFDVDALRLSFHDVLTQGVAAIDRYTRPRLG